MDRPRSPITYNEIPSNEEIFKAVKTLTQFPIDVLCPPKLAFHIRRMFAENLQQAVGDKFFGLSLKTGVVHKNAVYCSSHPLSAVQRIVYRVTSIQEEELLYRITAAFELYFEDQSSSGYPDNQFEVLKAELI